MDQISDSSTTKPMLWGETGAVSAGHPAAVSAGISVLEDGGNALDAMIAAQAALCVVLPSACGLGGDMLALVRTKVGVVRAINGTGKSPADPRFLSVAGPGARATVPALVAAWCEAHERWGQLKFEACLAPAIELAASGCQIGSDVLRAVNEQAERLYAGGAQDWVIARETDLNDIVVQQELAKLLTDISLEGAAAFYTGNIARAAVAAAERLGGSLAEEDFSTHRTVFCDPLSIDWQGNRIFVQPPMTQGVLLAMCLRQLERYLPLEPHNLDHVNVELTKACFEFRDRANEGTDLLQYDLSIDLANAAKRAGPRAYLHTTGVATSDRDGMVCSSLVSVFDDFGSCVFVPEGGFVLNNRADSFTAAPNDAAPAKRPVHTLAPMVWSEERKTVALATPGADGQIQTLLQILSKISLQDIGLAEAIAAPRWRSEEGKLLMPTTHPSYGWLETCGHNICDRPDGDSCFGGAVCAGIEGSSLFAASDWRREVCHSAF
jgi:gamma-glutamyltranspeptidase/glutathione hydrolase